MLALNVEFAFCLTDPFFVVLLRCVDAVWFLFCCVVNACERGDSLVWVGLAGTAGREWTLRKLGVEAAVIIRVRVRLWWRLNVKF